MNIDCSWIFDRLRKKFMTIPATKKGRLNYTAPVDLALFYVRTDMTPLG